MRWHHEGLDGVEHSLKGGYAYLNEFEKCLRSLGPRYHIVDKKTLAEADQLVEESKVFHENLKTLGQGQDRLIALNSFCKEASDKLVGQIRALDADRTLDQFMNRIFDHFSVTVDDIDTRYFRLTPGQLFTDSFPCLPKGTIVTCDRTRALAREDIDFLTWDHPMVRGAIDLTLSSRKRQQLYCSLERSEHSSARYFDRGHLCA